jgi:hypothetical protein
MARGASYGLPVADDSLGWVLDTFYEGRGKFDTTNDWIDFLHRSIGFEPDEFNERAKRVPTLAQRPTLN